MRNNNYSIHSFCNNKCSSCRCHGQICPPYWFIEFLEAVQKSKNSPLKVETFQYYTISDGEKKVYTDEDELPYYEKVGIKDPKDISFTNLFINGILQPAALFSFQKGILTLNSTEPPQKGTPIILQFIKIVNEG